MGCVCHSLYFSLPSTNIQKGEGKGQPGARPMRVGRPNRCHQHRCQPFTTSLVGEAGTAARACCIFSFRVFPRGSQGPFRYHGLCLGQNRRPLASLSVSWSTLVWLWLRQGVA